MAELTTVDASQETYLQAYISLARGDSAAGLVIVGGWPGLSRRMSDLCDRLADHGFSAEAPDLDADWLQDDGTAGDRWSVDLAVCHTHLATRMGTDNAKIGLLGFGLGGCVALRVARQSPDAWSAVAAVACPAEPLMRLNASDGTASGPQSCPARLFYGADEPESAVEVASRFAARERRAGSEIAVVVDNDRAETNLSVPGWSRLIAFLDLALTFDYAARSRNSP
jgi:dienelactone hydrolase